MKTKILLLFFLLIVTFGGFLRLYRIGDLGTFLTDQAVELSGARDILHGKFTLIGIKTSNSELRNGAVMYYSLAPFLSIFNFDPVAGGVLQTLLALGTIALVFVLSPVASALLALSPLLVIYSRQTLLAFFPLFFDVLGLFLIYKIVCKPNRFYYFFLGTLLGFSLQIHYSVISVLIFSLIFPIFFLNRKHWIFFYTFWIAGFIFGFFPMILFELRHDFFNIRMLLKYLQAFHQPNATVSLFGFWQETIAALFLGNNKNLATIFIFLFPTLIVYFWKKLNILERLCIAQIICTLIFTIVFQRDLRPPIILIAHYGLSAFTPIFILCASFLCRLLPRTLLIISLLFLVYLNFSAYGLANNHGYTMSEGWTLQGVKKSAQIIQSDNQGKNYNVVMLVDAQNQAFPLRYFLNDTNNPPLKIENYSGADFLYVIVRPNLDLKSTHIWELDSFGSYTIGQIWEIQNGYRLFRLEKAEKRKQRNFLTLIYPVRGRDLWVGHDLKQVDVPELPSSFLLQYDALTDIGLVKKLKTCQKCEFGIFYEVSEKLATDTLTPYILGDGHWSRPDKIFLSGYTLLQRERMINLVAKKFKEIFGYFPKTVGAWYLDPYSLNYLVTNYSITGYITVADQYDTDAQRYWGKPWGTAFYPQKYNSLAPANKLDNKLDILEIQWAQRHPTDGFCPGVPCSQNSLQANDYINNKRDTSYFEKILSFYLNPNNPFNQITIGMEVGQELTSFKSEHAKQLEILKSMDLEIVTVSQFTDWYRRTYPNFSPKMVVKDEYTTWENTPNFRKAWQNNNLVDIKNYENVSVFKDTFSVDKDKFLSREVVNETKGTNVNIEIKMERLKEYIIEKLSFFRYSIIDDQKVIGIQTGPTTLLGFWGGKGFGEYEFQFQTLAQFKSFGH